MNNDHTGKRYTPTEAPFDAPYDRITGTPIARAGDVIKRNGDTQDYVCACDEEHGYVYTAGHPECSEDMENFTVTDRASAAARIHMLEDVAATSGSLGARTCCARRQLHVIQVTAALTELVMTRGDITADTAEVTAWAITKGWDKPAMCETPGDPVQNSEPENVSVEAVGMKLALIHSEITEALEELRKGPGHLNIRIDEGSKKPEGFVIELADAYIRIVHLCGMLGLDLETAVAIKKTFNQTRSYRHGGKAA